MDMGECQGWEEPLERSTASGIDKANQVANRGAWAEEGRKEPGLDVWLPSASSIVFHGDPLNMPTQGSSPPFRPHLAPGPPRLLHTQPGHPQTPSLWLFLQE